MTRVTVTQHIASSPDAVFEAVSDISNFPNTSDDVLDVVFLTEQQSGVGTRFRETRLNNGKRMTFDLEVTEFAPEERRIRMVNDSHGTVWDSLLIVTASGDHAELTVAMDCRGHKLLARAMNTLLKGLYRKGIKKHLASLKSYCERSAN